MVIILSNLISRDDCKDLLKKVSKSTTVELISHRLEPVSESPVGFLGNHFRLILNTSDNGCLRFFVKCMPSVKSHAEYVSDMGAFKKEVELFRQLVPELQEIDNNNRQWSPKCYIARDDVLVFEDLSAKDYRLAAVEQGTMLDVNHCEFAVRTLANLHASSIVWEHKHGLRIDAEFPDAVKEVAYVNEPFHPRSKWLSSGIKALMHLCDKIRGPEKSQLLPAIIIKGIKNIGPVNGMYNSLCHGDLWMNNFMFSYDRDGEIVNCILLDYQLCRYAPCALDLMCCIYLITDRKTRDAAFARLIKTYEEHLVGILRNFGLAKSNLSMLKDCRKYRKFALIEALIFGLSIWLPSSEVEDALGSSSKCLEFLFGDKSPIVDRAFDSGELFRTQMTDLLDELLEICET